MTVRKSSSRSLRKNRHALRALLKTLIRVHVLSTQTEGSCQNVLRESIGSCELLPSFLTYCQTQERFFVSSCINMRDEGLFYSFLPTKSIALPQYSCWSHWFRQQTFCFGTQRGFAYGKYCGWRNSLKLTFHQGGAPPTVLVANICWCRTAVPVSLSCLSFHNELPNRNSRSPAPLLSRHLPPNLASYSHILARCSMLNVTLRQQVAA